MMDPISDLRSLDRDVAITVARLKLARERLARGEQPPSPFESHRHTSQQKTFDALRTLSVSKIDEPWRDALGQWVGYLVLTRTSFPLEEEQSKRERFVPEDDNGLSFRDATTQICTTSDLRVLSHAWETWWRRAPRVAAVIQERRVRSFEVARRLGIEHPLAPRLGVASGEIANAANEFLIQTDALAKDRTRRTPALEGFAPALHVIRLAHALGAVDAGWPRHVSARWVEEAFPAFSRELNALPLTSSVPVSPMSFARAACFAGVFLRESLAPASLPFALQRELPRTDAWGWGGAFAAALFTRAFHERALGAARSSSQDSARSIAEGFFFSLRIQAAATLLDLHERPGVIFEEATTRAFDYPLPSALGGAWPFPFIETAPRFWGALLGNRFAQELVDRFDVDWFRNPRAAADLRMRSRAPALSEEVTGVELSRHVARSFEEVLA